MYNRIEEVSNFESEIRNDPFKLLELIEMKMYGQMRAKYKYFQVTDTLLQFLTTKQDHREYLTDFAKRFKHTRDTMELILGKEFLHRFVRKTDKYFQATNNN